MNSHILLSSGLDVASGVLTAADDGWVEEELHDGLKIISMQGGQLRCRLDREDEHLIRGPSVCAVLSGRDERARQALVPGAPIDYLIVKVGRDCLEAELGCSGADLENVFGSNGRPALAYGPAAQSLQALHSQITACPLSGWARRLFVCGKALEIVAFAMVGLGGASVGGMTGRLSSDEHRRLEKARAYLLERLNDPPSLSELASAAGLNTRKLTEGFRAVFGTTVHGVLQEARLTEAHRLLSIGDMNVATAAYHVGYGPAHFSVVFRKRFGISPSELLSKA